MEYDQDFIFKKLKKRVENQRRTTYKVPPPSCVVRYIPVIEKIEIGEPIKIELEVVDLGVVE